MVRPCETFVAVLALVWTDARVDTQVVLQVVVVDKLGVAVEADVGALTCVLPHVDLEFVLSGESYFTDSAHVRFLSCMRPHVARQFFSLS